MIPDQFVMIPDLIVMVLGLSVTVLDLFVQLGLDQATTRLWFAFTLGVFTFFAPCAYPLLPGYVAYFLGNSDAVEVPARSTQLLRSVFVALVVSAGFFLVYAALGGAILVVGRRAFEDIAILELVVGAILVGLGITMALGRSPAVTVQLPERDRSTTGFFLFGVVYAGAAAGCTAPLFIGILFSSFLVCPVIGVGTLVAYAAGMSVVMVAVTALAGLGREHVLRVFSRNTGRIERAAGGLLVLAGIAQIYLFLFRFGGLEMLGLA